MIQFSITLLAFIRPGMSEVFIRRNSKCGKSSRLQLIGISISRVGAPNTIGFSSSMTSWDHGNTNLRQVFSRQAIQMSWDYVETNLLDGIVSLPSAAEWIASALEALPRSPADAEVNFSGAGNSGQVKLLQTCKSRTNVTITIRPA